MAWSCRRGPSPRRGTNLRPGLAGRGQEELRPLQTDGLGLLSCRSRGGRHVVFYPTLKVGAGLRLRVGWPPVRQQRAAALGPGLRLQVGWPPVRQQQAAASGPGLRLRVGRPPVRQQRAEASGPGAEAAGGLALGEAASGLGQPGQPGRHSPRLSPCRSGWSWPRSWAWGCPSGSSGRAWTISTTCCRPGLQPACPFLRDGGTNV